MISWPVGEPPYLWITLVRLHHHRYHRHHHHHYQCHLLLLGSICFAFISNCNADDVFNYRLNINNSHQTLLFYLKKTLRLVSVCFFQLTKYLLTSCSIFSGNIAAGWCKYIGSWGKASGVTQLHMHFNLKISNIFHICRSRREA